MWNCHSWPLDISTICLWYLYVYICTGISLYFLISWLFWMGSHWSHWTAKNSLYALAVLNGGYIISFTWVKLTFPYIFLSVDCFEWALIGHIEQQRVHSVLWQFRMGGSIVSFTQVNLKIWARFKFYSCFTELFLFL